MSASIIINTLNIGNDRGLSVSYGVRGRIFIPEMADNHPRQRLEHRQYNKDKFL